ncbi:ATP-dependent DNA helicase PcrA [Candidatus Mycoplasma haematohominis]|uniref:DNA 3'-5' helicase n=1 Tax=Candidatus Mycoplasma haematohominis TaxID=1494318 RepID=A0A478FS10_9MOLU|nr:ATP-dependent DNA helicase PcrA [Candidatus Mycoplasma haemohominis]
MHQNNKSLKPYQNISGDTQQQIDAFQSPLTPTLVIAGAGTGKTLVLAKRFEYLVRTKNIDPTKILAITFSNTATKNMKNRIFKLLEDVPSIKEIQNKCHISTFHKFCMHLIEEEIGTIRKEKIYGENREKRLILEIVKQEEIPRGGLEDTRRVISELRWICKKNDKPIFTEEELSRVREEIIRPLTARKISNFLYNNILHLYKKYDQKLKELNAYTLDDILLVAYQLLKNPEAAKKWSNKFDAILCDEFQDIDDVQFEILKKLSEHNNNILCVGDPDQSIYEFRGAVPDIFNKFKKHFYSLGKEVNIRKLEMNFRSTPEILEISNKLISFNHKQDGLSKTLHASNPSLGIPVNLHLTNSNTWEEDWIIEKIIELNEKQKVPLKEIAILTRNKSHKGLIENKLLAKRIPYENKTSIHEFLNKEEIKDLISWLDIALINNNKILGKAMKRVINKPRRGIGVKTIEELFKNGWEVAVQEIMRFSIDKKIIAFRQICRKIQEIAKKPDSQVSPEQKIQTILKTCQIFEYYSGHPNKFDHLRSFLSGIIPNSKSIEEIKEKITRFNPRSLDGDDLIISTIHRVKGLEFDYVFLMRFDEDKLPSNISIDKTKKGGFNYVEEERRLAYVAMTRAKKGLFLSSSAKDSERGISRFLKDIKDLIHEIIEDESEENKYLEEEENETDDYETIDLLTEEESEFIEDDN